MPQRHQHNWLGQVGLEDTDSDSDESGSEDDNSDIYQPTNYTSKGKLNEDAPRGDLEVHQYLIEAKLLKI